MSESEASKGLSLWPKLLLMGAVILVAFLYLRSVDRSGTETQKPETIEPAAEPAETSEKDVGLPMRTQMEADASGAGGATPEGTDAEVTTKTDSTDQADVEAIADIDVPSLQPPEPAPAPAAEETRLEPESPGTTAASAEARPVAEPPVAVEGPGAGEVRSEDPMATSDSESREDGMEQEIRAAEVDAVAVPPAAPLATTTDSVPDMPPLLAAPEVAAPPVQEPVIVPAQSPARETLEVRRARVISEYEAMRKRAEEEMRDRWERGGIPGPYGYPHYAPGSYPPSR